MSTWSAPGRVNLIGEHVDYNGGRVLPFAIDRRIDVAITERSDDRVFVTSEGLGTAEVTALRPGDDEGWERYVAGGLWAFGQATGHEVAGVDIEVTSTLPTGAGLSSSAAIECAVIGALDDLAGSGLSARQIAELALRAEREYVGVPCGPMDQYAVMLGQPDHALLLASDTLETEQVPLRLGQAGLELLVINTMVKHDVGDGEYGDRRAACEQAADQLGLESLSLATVEQVKGLSDPVLRRRAHHVVTEIERVERVAALLEADRPADIGGYLSASHQSLTDDFEVSSVELDLAVDAALAAGALGARMTGAGFGGSAIALCRANETDVVTERVRRAFERAELEEPEIWAVSPSAGAGPAR